MLDAVLHLTRCFYCYGAKQGKVLKTLKALLLLLLQGWCMHLKGIQMQMMIISTCQSIFGTLCAEVLRATPQPMRTQTLTEVDGNDQS